MPEPSTAPWRSIRFQISVVLLTSALNGAVLLTVAVLLLAVDQASEAGEPQLVAAARALAGMADPRVLTAGLAWVVFVSLATVLMAVRLRWTLSRPLDRLARAAERVAAGELDVAIPPAGNTDEFDRLAGALEGMRRHLVGSIERLDQQNLERGVMLRALGDAVLMVDGDGAIVEFNPSAAKMFEAAVPARPALREGLHLGALLPELGDRRGQAELQLDTRHGRRNLVAEVSSVVGPDLPGARARVIVLRDVTEQLESEQIKRDFLSVVTHELKTPLTAVQGFAKLLLMGKGGPPTPTQADLLRRIGEQSEVLRERIDDLLDATRLEGGTLKMTLAPVPVGDLVEQARKAFEGAAVAAGVELGVEGEGLDRVRVNVDAGRFQQILGNLLRNALKFTPRGGRITVRAGGTRQSAFVEVEDTGVGIPEKAIPSLFQKFYQVDRGDTRNQGGAGLGLYICNQLARAMGGSLGVASKVGQGSRFRLVLPRVGEG